MLTFEAKKMTDIFQDVYDCHDKEFKQTLRPMMVPYSDIPSNGDMFAKINTLKASFNLITILTKISLIAVNAF